MAENIISDTTHGSPTDASASHFDAVWRCASDLETSINRLESLDFIIGSMIGDAERWIYTGIDRGEARPNKLMGALTTIWSFVREELEGANGHVNELYDAARAMRRPVQQRDFDVRR